MRKKGKSGNKKIKVFKTDEKDFVVKAGNEVDRLWAWAMAEDYKALSNEELQVQLDILGNSLKRAGKSELQFVKFVDDLAENMPSDARVDFFYKPTYVATAVFLYAKQRCPELFMDGRYTKWLDILCKASAGRNLLGHGYYALDEQKEYLLMFERAGARAFAEAVATEE